MVEFATLEDLERIYRLMTDGAPDLELSPRSLRGQNTGQDLGRVTWCRGLLDAPAHAPDDGPGDVGAPAHQRAHAVDVDRGNRLADHRGHTGLAEDRVGCDRRCTRHRRAIGANSALTASATACPASDRKRPDSK